MRARARALAREPISPQSRQADEARAAAPRSIRSADAGPSLLDAPELLRLQRTAGNSAVQRALAERTAKEKGTTSGGNGRRSSRLDIADLLPTFTVTPIAAPPSFIPRAGAPNEICFDPPAPDGGSPAPAPAPATPASDSCSQPISMNKVTSGPFLNGLTVGSYYPDLASLPYPASAGPFDLGDRAGSAVQLFGVIPSPCQPTAFRLAQTTTANRVRINGVPDATEGTTFDDLARSGRNTTQAPFRQEFLGGGAAPLGYIISMLDPPSIPYDATTTSGEFDVSFVTSLIGPSGRQSVSWSISVRIANGAVTSNTVT